MHPQLCPGTPNNFNRLRCGLVKPRPYALNPFQLEMLELLPPLTTNLRRRSPHASPSDLLTTSVNQRFIHPRWLRDALILGPKKSVSVLIFAGENMESASRHNGRCFILLKARLTLRLGTSMVKSYHHPHGRDTATSMPNQCGVNRPCISRRSESAS